MDFYSPLLLAFSWSMLILLAATPLLRAADSAPQPVRNRNVGLDGLRGLLAVAVFFHHASIYHAYSVGGRWALPPSRLFTNLGPVAVAAFFMITGFLFWSRLLKEDGQHDWITLYTNRFFRIAPLYLVAIAGMLFAVLAAAHFELHDSPQGIVRSVMRWSALSLLQDTSFNGDKFPDLWLAGVTWSIRFEWFFYLSMPVLAILARKRSAALYVIAASLCFLLVRPAARVAVIGERPPTVLICFFLVGMLCGSLQQMRWRLRLPEWLGTSLCAALVAIAISGASAYTWRTVLCIGSCFLLIVVGKCTFFGFLTSRPMRRMGDVSYGIYLLQGFALGIVFRPSLLRNWIAARPERHWAAVVVSGCLLLAMATLAHVYVERPGIAAGRRWRAAHPGNWAVPEVLARLAGLPAWQFARDLYLGRPQYAGGRLLTATADDGLDGFEHHQQIEA